jgi:hypothetical protein
MPANILGQDATINSRRFANADRVPVWWQKGVGNVIPEGADVTSAFEIAHMMYKMAEMPMYVKIDDEYVQVADRAIMREPIDIDPEWQYFGTASSNYRTMDNGTFATILDPLTQYSSLETVGAR